MTSLLRPLARLMTGSVYVLLGLDAFRSPGGRVTMAGPTLAGIRRVVPLPEDDELLVRTNAAGHAWWTLEDPMARTMQRVQSTKNVAMVGGLLLAAADRD